MIQILNNINICESVRFGRKVFICFGNIILTVPYTYMYSCISAVSPLIGTSVVQLKYGWMNINRSSTREILTPRKYLTESECRSFNYSSQLLAGLDT